MTQVPKRVLITGGAIRLGRAIAECLAERGYDLAIHYFQHETDALALAARYQGRARCELFPADLLDLTEAEALVERVEDRLGAISAVVLSAATFDRAPLEQLSGEGIEATLRLNLAAPLLIASRAGLRMKARGYGSIVTLLDFSTDRPRVDYLPYEVAKAGLRTATFGLARALAPEVRVNGIAPGSVLLPEGTTENIEEAARKATLLQRKGSVEDVAAAVLYLLEAAPFVTGSVLTVDGGRSLR